MCRPDLLDYHSCDFSQPLDCLEKAFSIAEDELNTTRLIKPESIRINALCLYAPVIIIHIDVCVPRPPEKLIMMYVSTLKKAFPEMVHNV